MAVFSRELTKALKLSGQLSHRGTAVPSSTGKGQLGFGIVRDTFEFTFQRLI